MYGQTEQCSVRCDTDCSQAPIRSRTAQQNSCSNATRSVSCKTTARERRWVAPTAIVSAPHTADSHAHNKEEQIFRLCAGTEQEQTQPAERSDIQLRKQQVLRAFKRIISGVSLSLSFSYTSAFFTYSVKQFQIRLDTANTVHSAAPDRWTYPHARLLEQNVP